MLTGEEQLKPMAPITEKRRIMERHGIIIDRANRSINNQPPYYLMPPLLYLTHRAHIEHLGVSPRFRYPARGLFYDLGNLANSAGRLEWTRTNCIRTGTDPLLWYQLASLDIEISLAKMRSIADHLSMLLGIRFNLPPSTYRSFNDLLVYVSKQRTIEPALRDCLIAGELWKPDSKEQTWFAHALKVRNHLVHLGAHCQIFGVPGDGLLFQIYSRNFRALTPSLPHIVNQKDINYFNRYFSLLWSSIDLSIHFVGKAILGDGHEEKFRSQLSCFGLPIVKRWLLEFKSALQES